MAWSDGSIRKALGSALWKMDLAGVMQWEGLLKAIAILRSTENVG